MSGIDCRAGSSRLTRTRGLDEACSPAVRSSSRSMESVLFDIPIIDCHQHFWDLDANYLPWLRDEPQIAFRYGDYSAIKRNYLPSDYARDTAGFQIEASVFIETEWDRSDPVAEMRWVSQLKQ